MLTLTCFCLYLPVLSILDTLTITAIQNYTGHRPRYLSFQTARACGSVGFMIPSLILYAGAITPSNQTLILFASGYACVAALCAFKLPDGPARLPHVPGGPAPFRVAAAFVFNHRALRITFIAIFLAAVGLGNFYVFFPRYLQELGFDRTAVGLIINCGVLLELVLIPLAGRFLQLIGFWRLLLIGFSLLALRLLVLGWLPSNGPVILSQLTHAPLVVVLFVVTPVFLQQSAPDGFRFSLQSLYFSLTTGLARVCGPVFVACMLSDASINELAALQSVSLYSAVLVLLALVLLVPSGHHFRTTDT